MFQYLLPKALAYSLKFSIFLTILNYSYYSKSLSYYFYFLNPTTLYIYSGTVIVKCITCLN